MQDAFVEISRHSLTRKLLKKVGLRPPVPLLRAYRPWSETLLQGKQLCLFTKNEQVKSLELWAQKLGAKVHLWSQPSHEAKSPSLMQVWQASICDTRAFQHIRDLEQMYRFYHEVLKNFGSHHRTLILYHRPSPQASPREAALAKAIEGFMRSLAREAGPRGATVNALQWEEGSLDASTWQGIAGFFLSDHAAFVTGQVLTLDGQTEKKSSMPLAGSLAGKRALVTGAAQGIGYAIARRLAEEGAHVYALDRSSSQAALDELVQAIDGESLCCDLSSQEDRVQLLDRISAMPAPLDIIVHNAGITRDRTLYSMQVQDWNAVMQVNLEAILHLTEESLRRGHFAKGARILGLSSISGIAGNFGQCNYSAAKAGIIGMVENLANHLRPLGMTANAVAPGFIETQMTSRVPFLVRLFARRFSSLGQGGNPDDVAEMIAFLASPLAQAINGKVIRVCGGNYMGA